MNIEFATYLEFRLIIEQRRNPRLTEVLFFDRVSSIINTIPGSKLTINDLETGLNKEFGELPVPS